MDLLKKLKSTLGLATHEEGQETRVTVEYEPDAESEEAVKGTDDPAAAGTDAAGSTGTITDEPPASPSEETESGAAEPGEAAGPSPEAAEPEPTGGEPRTDSPGSTEPDTAAEPTEADHSDGTEPATEHAGDAEESVQSIDGIGPAYAERLREVGVETVGDLQGANVTDLAEETGLSEKRIERWVDSAGG